MPKLQLIITRWYISNFECPIFIRKHVVGIVHDNQPSRHAAMRVTGQLDRLWLRKVFFHFCLELWLGFVEGRIFRAVGMDIMENAVAIDDVQFSSCRGYNYMRSIPTVLLVQGRAGVGHFFPLLNITD